MILTPIAASRRAAVLRRFADTLSTTEAQRVLARIARPGSARRAGGRSAERHRRAALRLAASFGMPAVAGRPSRDFSWNGHRLRGGTEAYVLLHEVAHFQLAAPQRRRCPDFALGAGPESGARRAADRAIRVSVLEREKEEAMASLLGILWEVELRQPALASFLDQNWLEGAGRRGAAAHFEAVLAALRARRVLDSGLRPVRRLAGLANRQRPAQDRALCGPA